MANTNGITWQSLSPVTDAAYANAINARGNMAQAVQGLTKVGSDYMGLLAKRAEEIRNKNINDITGAAINQLNQANSLTDVEALRKSGALDARQLLEQSGGLFDVSKFNTAVSNLPKDANDRFTNMDALLMSDPKTKEAYALSKSKLALGDTAGAIAALKDVNLPVPMLRETGKDIQDQFNTDRTYNFDREKFAETQKNNEVNRKQTEQNIRIQEGEFNAKQYQIANDTMNQIAAKYNLTLPQLYQAMQDGNPEITAAVTSTAQELGIKEEIIRNAMSKYANPTNGSNPNIGNTGDTGDTSNAQTARQAIANATGGNVDTAGIQAQLGTTQKTINALVEEQKKYPKGSQQYNSIQAGIDQSAKFRDSLRSQLNNANVPQIANPKNAQVANTIDPNASFADVVLDGTEDTAHNTAANNAAAGQIYQFFKAAGNAGGFANLGGNFKGYADSMTPEAKAADNLGQLRGTPEVKRITNVITKLVAGKVGVGKLLKDEADDMAWKAIGGDKLPAGVSINDSIVQAFKSKVVNPDDRELERFKTSDRSELKNLVDSKLTSDKFGYWKKYAIVDAIRNHPEHISAILAAAEAADKNKKIDADTALAFIQSASLITPEGIEKLKGLQGKYSTATGRMQYPATVLAMAQNVVKYNPTLSENPSDEELEKAISKMYNSDNSSIAQKARKNIAEKTKRKADVEAIIKKQKEVKRRNQTVTLQNMRLGGF